ncbi:pyridoxamine 5'-phosphate oxidase family protein, partial [Pseudomonadota bacterium]
MTNIDLDSPFHRGEREIQSRQGVREQTEKIGQRFVHSHLPDQHQAFYRQLPYLLVGTIDDHGRPWASIMAGRPGFIQAPDAHKLSIDARPIYGDPLNDTLSPGVPIGLLGIEYHSRRRNRVNGKVVSLNDGQLQVSVDQAFGNCPQYIQARDYRLLDDIDHIGVHRRVHHLQQFSEQASEIISQADNFYIATHCDDESVAGVCGADVSHRGGKPGFVRLEDERNLTFPDFGGNNHFNTLGNIQLNPRAGLLFIDFNNGDLLYLTCSAEIIWDSEESQFFSGAERLVNFTLDEGILIENALPVHWDLLEYSPSLDITGSWKEVDQKISERIDGNVYRDYKVAQIEPESEVISSFYLQPIDDENISHHKAGQLLPIEIITDSIDSPLRRTYTISNAPNGDYYRLSVKRESASAPGLPAGVASNYFHDQIKVGS